VNEELRGLRGLKRARALIRTKFWAYLGGLLLLLLAAGLTSHALRLISAAFGALPAVSYLPPCPWRRLASLSTRCATVLAPQLYFDGREAEGAAALPRKQGFFFKLRRQIKRKGSVFITMKAVITVLGKDQTGIIARVSMLLYREEVNILDISQTIMGGVFTMIMLVEFSRAGEKFALVREKLNALGDEIGLEIRIQHSQIFDAMHKV
jgi:ACT domain-containing protein